VGGLDAAGGDTRPAEAAEDDRVTGGGRLRDAVLRH
jgi:hypothetical protein